MDNMLHSFAIIGCIMAAGIFLTESYWFRKLVDEKIRTLAIVVTFTMVSLLGFNWFFADRASFGCLEDHIWNFGWMLGFTAFLSIYTLGRSDIMREMQKKWLKNRGYPDPMEGSEKCPTTKS